MKFRKTLASWLTNKYSLIIRNEENLAEETSFNFTYSKVVLLATTVLIALLMLALILVKTVLAQWLDPRAARIESNTKLIQLAIKLDSLDHANQLKELFIQNVMDIIKGETDSVYEEASDAEISLTEELTNELNPEHIPLVDSQFRAEFEKNNQSLLSDLESYSSDLQELYFFVPITGIVMSSFNLKQEHYGIDVVSNENEPIKSVADGTVILSSWTQDAGYVIVIQHRTNLISVYKHNSALLKKLGNFVHAGEVIAIIGNSGELTSGPHLHFEIWYNGSPVDPEEFVSF